MPNPSQIIEKRKQLIPIVTQAFAELGYRRATTAELAERCDVRENILYRLWPDKKAMFIAAIDYVYEQAASVWEDILSKNNADLTTAEQLLMHEVKHFGDSGLHRIVFAGLSEADEPEIRDALHTMYGRFHKFIRKHITEHRGHQRSERTDEVASAWAIIGLGNVANIGLELGLFSDRTRKRLLSEVGQLLLDGRNG